MIRSDVFHRASVPVKLDFADTSTKAWFEEQNFRIYPEVIQIFGPKNKVQKVKSVQSHKISRNLANQQEFMIDLALGDDDVSYSETSVRVNIINEASRSRVLNNVPIQSPAGLKFLPPRVTVIIKGTPSDLRELKLDSIVATVDERPDHDGAYSIKVSVPNHILLVDVTPKKVYPIETSR
ncbi:MAG: hypothetical protein U1C33_07830, partial [Candidatus Cloacimonadaceae bacterium]|nr:hypothetical protein [Candidatus Cloacimonadaceae bacterium]